jgi:hypothetical protein
MTRLDTGSFAFRRAILGGAPVGAAAEGALAADEAFDPGHGLTALFNVGLVTASNTNLPEKGNDEH